MTIFSDAFWIGINLPIWQTALGCFKLDIMITDNNKDIFFPAGTAEVNIIPVMQGEDQMKVDAGDLPDTLPVLALRNAVIFPGMVYPVTIGRRKSITLIKDAEKRDSFIGAVPQVDVTVEEPEERDLYEYGTVCRIMKVLEMPDGTITAILQGIKRLRLDGVISYEPYITARVKYIEDIVPENDNSTKMIAESLKEKASVIIKSSSFAPKEAVGALKSIDNYAFLVNFIATTVEVENFFEKVQLLGVDDVTVRAMKLLQVLDTQIQLLKIKQEINQKVKSDIDQQQREYYLNNQLRTIQEELGMDEEEEFERLRAKAKTKKWPEAVGKQFEKELAKLEKYNPSSPDYSIQYNYIEFMLDLPWGEIGVDVVLECTGFYTSKAKSQALIDAGAKKVVISAPAGNDLPTIVYNVNHETLKPEDTVISAASCTTNCLAPMADALNKFAPIQSGIMVTIHAYTGDQMTLDGPQRKGDLRRSRAAAVNIVPNSTGAAKAIGLVIPELNGKLIGSAQRVPTPTGSTTILTAVVEGNVTKEQINAAMKAASNESFGYNEDEIVSSDIVGMRFGSLFDATQTMVNELPNGGCQVQVVSWYDNENSYTSQMVRTIKYFAELA